MRPLYIDCSPEMRGLLDAMGRADNITILDGDPPPDRLAGLIAAATVVLNGHTPMDAALLAGARQLRSIVFLGTGASSYIDMAAAERLGIRVRTVRGYGDRAVAEHAFALLLAAARDLARMDRGIRGTEGGTWSPRQGLELAGRTLGLVGLGGVGAEMARIAAAFGMRVVAWNRSGVPAGVPAEAASLEDVLTTCDAVSLHLALVAETRGLIDARRLALMRPGAILVNTARGALVDEAALVAALRTGRITHAALDVFEREPLDPAHPLARLPNVTLSAHAAWKTGAASRRLLEAALDLAQADAQCLAEGRLLGP